MARAITLPALGSLFVGRWWLRLFTVACISLFMACGEKIPEGPKSGEWFVSRSYSTPVSAKTAEEMLQKWYPEYTSLMAEMPSRQINIDAITYRTLDPQGKSVVASGLVAYPSDMTVRGSVVELHGTILWTEEAPTKNILQPGVLFAFMGYAVVIPDLIGFGASASLPHPYLHAENTGRVTADMVFAAREYLQQQQVATAGPMYAEGYSQGGHGALAFQRFAEREYPAELKLTRVFAGGGPYDLTGTLAYFTTTDFTSMPSSLPYIALGLNYGDKLGLNFAHIFREPLLSYYEEWYSKRYLAQQIDEVIGTTKISEFMHEDMFSSQRNADFDKLYASLAKNSLVDWTPQAPVRLYHAMRDTVVPFVNADNAFESFKARGCDVKLHIADGEDVDHAAMSVSFYLDLFEELL